MSKFFAGGGEMMEWKTAFSTSGNYTQVEILQGTVEKNSSTIGPPAGIEPTPVRCRCTALTTKLRRYLTGASVINVYLGR